MINLYKPVDDTFILVWNKIQAHGNPSWIAQLQNQLTEALPNYLECTESQAVDLRVSQQWLRTMLWQMCVSQGLVSSVAADPTLTFKYPIEISRDLLSMTHQFSQHAMEVHGMGLVSLTHLRNTTVPVFASTRGTLSRCVTPVTSMVNCQPETSLPIGDYTWVGTSPWVLSF